ncbi:MAG TPA: uroporphyrinogen decarboxylase family protein [Armatimonadota bacterium]|nr:uroporphyrinogen decarboxylase family protein [Armatimonadota bacterium]HOS42567.1 uroporphyrinogen decarboxylase family protein [Armatimonadota bacterium]
MTYRDLFREIMFYGDYDRMPVLHWTGWEETMERWYAEGLPRDANVHEYFHASPLWAGIWTRLSLYPWFDEEVLEETEEYRIVRDRDGVVCQDWKHKSCIPHYIDFTLKDAGGWEAYKKRLQPHPDRIPADIDARIAAIEASGLPVEFEIASMMGWIRNWMGVENMSYLMYDDRDVYADMVMTLADLTCWAIDQVLPKVKSGVDYAHGWEDICGKSGPLVSPEIFDECVAPGYRKIRNKLEEYGVKLLGIDSDGDVRDLVGHWLDAGVNVQFPIEVGTWKGDANAYRKRYGKELRVIGNFDKLALERGRADVEAEFARLMPLMKDGGFLLLPDHLITPGVSLAEYTWYLDQVRALRF